MLKLRIVLCVTKNQLRNKATKFAIEDEKKTLVEFWKLKNLLHLYFCIMILVSGFRGTHYLFRKGWVESILNTPAWMIIFHQLRLLITLWWHERLV